MAVLSALEIYRYARMAGFSPDQAVTMTAIALAESGGETGAHNPRGEDSRGLWQINVAAHHDLAGQDLYDPLTNARAAFRVSSAGADVSPWTTTHRGGDARYLAYRSEAENAARAAGDTATGTWSGTPGYGHPLAAGAGGGGAPVVETADAVPPAGGGATQQFVDLALAQAGDRYVFGAEADLDDADPTVFDCSELVQWAAARVGVDVPDGSYNQYLQMSGAGGAMSVEEAIRTPGALLFSFSEEPTPGGGRPAQAHVAISLGDGRTIEAMNSRRGVLVAEADTERFNYAAVIPGLAGATPTTLPTTVPTTVPTVLAAPAAAATAGLAGAATAPAFAAVDTDRDGVVDGAEAQLRTDAARADTDGDGSSDGYELFRLGTDPTRADSDGDRIGDSAELLGGTDPTAADSDLDGRADGGDTSPDTDADGLSDLLEQILGTRVDSIDSDSDGVTDLLEHVSGLDPLAPVTTGLPGVPSLTASSLPSPAAVELPDDPAVL